MEEQSKALRYHSDPVPGKLAIVSTKPCDTAAELSLAYSPGVSEPCLAIERDPNLIYKYTAKGNLVAVISNGTAVLGLGNIGAEASKPVMEGKAILFKRFADIDVFDLELKSTNTDEFVNTVVNLAPTFGGINLEDIKSPECFEIEEALKAKLDIPVFHDDQHGTAIIASAALINALEVTNRKITDIKLVISGAGAAAIACARLLVRLGLPRENIFLCDTKGVVYRGRAEGMNKYKEEFATVTSARSLADALRGADVFFGLSKKDALSPEMLLTMAANPIVFAMANPDPEIPYDIAKATRPDVIVATGRSDFPNQVNNVLGFPFIFRGALDVRAKAINDEMKLAAVYALARLAKESVPESVRQAYGDQDFRFGPDYLIPKPFDPRVLYYVAPAVAEAAIATGVAREAINIGEYTLNLKGKNNRGRDLISRFYQIARTQQSTRIALVEGRDPRVLTAAAMATEEGLAAITLIGDKQAIESAAANCGVNLDEMEILDPALYSHLSKLQNRYKEIRSLRNGTLVKIEEIISTDVVFANLLLAEGIVDGLVCGVNQIYRTMAKPIVEILGFDDDAVAAAGLHIASLNNQTFLLADTTMNADMTSEKLANTALLAAKFAVQLGIEPRVALLSFSSFGSFQHPNSDLVCRAREIVREKNPQLEIRGEMQADLAMMPHLFSSDYPESLLTGPANVLVFPDMQSGNIAYKLLQRLAGARIVGPILLGIKSPAHIMNRHATSDDVFNMIAVTAAQAALKRNKPLGVSVERIKTLPIETISVQAESAKAQQQTRHKG